MDPFIYALIIFFVGYAVGQMLGHAKAQKEMAQYLENAANNRGYIWIGAKRYELRRTAEFEPGGQA